MSIDHRPDDRYDFGLEEDFLKGYAHRIGAVLYIVWGVLQVRAALNIYAVSIAVPPELESLGGRIFQSAWNMYWVAVFSIGVAAVYNWKNKPLGYWINLIMVSLANLGYIFAVLIPGYVPLGKGLVGLTVWVLAVIFTTIGYLKQRS